jgi:hypothetical protein
MYGDYYLALEDQAASYGDKNLADDRKTTTQKIGRSQSL